MFRENRKENIIKSTSVYGDAPCKSFKLRELVPKYIDNDTDSECINSDNQNEVGCIIDPSDKDNYLDETEVIIYYKNKRIYSVVDINDELICENTKLTPVINEFYLEDGKTSVVTKINVSAYLSWDTENIKYYCLTEVNNVDKCVWNSVSNKLVYTDYTLSNKDGTKIVYAFIKDKYENISEGKRYEITLDTSAPTNNSVRINNNEEYTTSTSVTLTLSSIDAKEICISNTNSCTNWIPYATSKSHTLTSGDGTKTVYAWFRDEYGNTTTDYVSDSITFNINTAYPTVTASAVSNNTTLPKISIKSTEAGTYCVNTSSTRTDFNNCILTGSISANSVITTSVLMSSGTYYVHAKDSANNIGISSVVSIIKVTAAGSYIQILKPFGLNTILEGGLYRFQGTNPNNYICFGTSTKSLCTGNHDRYMYRIIGINSSGQLKIIKMHDLGTMEWSAYDDRDKNITWPNSIIYSNINGNSFLKNTTYVPSGWENKRETTTWKYRDASSIKLSANELYEIENFFISTVSAKVGLMYLHDYSYSSQKGGLICSSPALCNASWLFSYSGRDVEFTMQRYAKDTSTCWFIWGNGYLVWEYLNWDGYVRPVFFLTTSVKYASGSGTVLDSFIIS